MRATQILVAVLAMVPLAASAAGGAVTVYGGYRAGGGFTDAVTNESIDTRGAGSVAASVDFPVDASRQVQLLVSHQSSKLEVSALPGSPLAALDGRSMSVTHLHLGGTSFFAGPIGLGPYVVGGFGATRLEPGLSGYSGEWRPSLNIGIGYQWPLGEQLALRFETRAYVTLVDSEGGLFCSGGCVVTIRGDTFTQLEAQIGLSMRF
jgi:hypothetical protein